MISVRPVPPVLGSSEVFYNLQHTSQACLVVAGSCRLCTQTTSLPSRVLSTRMTLPPSGSSKIPSSRSLTWETLALRMLEHTSEKSSTRSQQKLTVVSILLSPISGIEPCLFNCLTPLENPVSLGTPSSACGIRSSVTASTYSSIQNNHGFVAAEFPLPILVADERQEGQPVLLSTNTTNYEFTPWELGSFDSVGFVPLQYVGSNFDAGEIPSHEKCVTGFDELSFVFGTSSSLFNQFLLQINTTDMVPAIFKDAVTSILVGLDENYMDVADWSPSKSHQTRPIVGIS